MIRTITITISNSQIRDTGTIISHIISSLNIAENKIIRWAITATNADKSNILVTYAK